MISYSRLSCKLDVNFRCSLLTSCVWGRELKKMNLTFRKLPFDGESPDLSPSEGMFSARLILKLIGPFCRELCDFSYWNEREGFATVKVSVNPTIHQPSPFYSWVWFVFITEGLMKQLLTQITCEIIEFVIDITFCLLVFFFSSSDEP